MFSPKSNPESWPSEQDSGVRPQLIRNSAAGSRPAQPSVWSLSQKTRFTENLSSLLRSGIPALQALQRLQSKTGKLAVRQVLTVMIADLENGASLAQAMARHPQVFDDFYVQSIDLGEQSGKLDLVFDRLNHLFQWQAQTRQRLVLLLIYPVILLLVIGLVATIFLNLILPMLQGAAVSAQLTLPAWLNGVLVVAPFWMVPLAGAVIFALGLGAFFTQTGLGRRIGDEGLLILPFIGGLTRCIQGASLLQGLSLTYEAGLAVDHGFKLALNTVDNGYLRESCSYTLSQARAGETLCNLLGESGIFEDELLESIALAEESGMLGKALKAQADHLSEQVNHRIGFLFKLMPSVCIIGLALMMGGILMTFYVSLFGVIGATIQSAIGLPSQ